MTDVVPLDFILQKSNAIIDTKHNYKPMSYILFPGRHHLLTNFQFDYLNQIARDGLKNIKDIDGKSFSSDEKIDELIFAITSANYKFTRRNPFPLYQRAMAIQDFSSNLPVTTTVYSINDIGFSKNFAEYTIKRIHNQSEGRLKLTPDNTIVACSTPVLKMYQKLGFRILPVELLSRDFKKYADNLPWEVIEDIANNKGDWRKNKLYLEKTHPASKRLWETYDLGNKVRQLFADEMVGDDGDITETRDYNTYVRSMDHSTEQKYHETSAFVNPGRIGDIGCAVGSWIKFACQDSRLAESDFYGIEVARKLFDVCEQRKNNGDFKSDYVFFSKKNAITGLVFEPNSMDTILTSSLTHEIESYGGRKDLLKFIKNRAVELRERGRWINRDVVGPDNGNQTIYMELNSVDGRNSDYDQEIEDRNQLKEYLDGLSTYTKFLRFSKDFRKNEGGIIKYEVVSLNNKNLIKLKLKDACEFVTKKDYTDNWQSEMHETFCFWSFNDWKEHIKKAGLSIHPQSRAFVNPWVIKKRVQGKVQLYETQGKNLQEIDYPVSNMILVAEKRP